MKTKPIIFSAPMIVALLEGRKTQTRRVLKPQPSAEHSLHFSAFHDRKAIFRNDAHGIRQDVPVPYTPGDLLWVRETWNLFLYSQDGEEAWPANPMPTKEDYIEIKRQAARVDCGFHYKASPINSCWDNARQWRSPIHMPRWASRLTLEVTDVRVERVQDITEEDAIAEGMTEGISYPRYLKSLNGPRCAFMALWNSIHGPDAWQRNDWVAAYTFTVHHRNVDDLLAEREVAA